MERYMLFISALLSGTDLTVKVFLPPIHAFEKNFAFEASRWTGNAGSLDSRIHLEKNEPHSRIDHSLALSPLKNREARSRSHA